MDVHTYNDMIKKASKSVQARNAVQSFEAPSPSCITTSPAVAESAVLGIRPTTDEEALNKTERAYLAWLRAMQEPWIGVQCMTLKLGHDCRYTPDFWVLDAAGLRAIDTKGYNKKSGKPVVKEDAMIKMRLAARLFPFIRFVMAYRKGMTWEHIDIKP